MERITVTPREAREARQMILDGTAPANMYVVGSLYFDNCTALTALPEGLSVDGSLDLTNCTSLTTLPEGLSVGGWLILTGCTALTALPHRIKIGRHSGRMIAHSDYPLIWDGARYHAGCRSLTSLPHRVRIGPHSGRMIAHSDYPLIWDGTYYHAGCRHLTPHQALKHWGNKKRTDDRARVFHAAILEHQREMLEQI